MEFIVQIIAVILFLAVVFVNNKTTYFYLLIAAIFINSTGIALPNYLLGGFSPLIVAAVIIRFVLRNKNILRVVVDSKLAIPIVLCLIVFMGVSFLGNRDGIFQTLFRGYVNVSDLFWMIIAFSFIDSEEDFNRFFKAYSVSILLLCFYGLITFFIGENPFSLLVSEHLNGVNVGDEVLTHSVRPRVASIFRDSHTFGYFIMFPLLYYISELLHDNLKLNAKLVFVLSILFLSLLLCASRTPIFATMMCILILFILNLSNRRTLKVFLMASFIIVLGVLISPRVGQSIDNLLGSIEDPSQVEGSSLEMRIEQYGSAYLFFNQSPIFGNGFGYIGRELEWDQGESIFDDEMFGFESVVFLLMIEQGFIGIVGYLFSMIWLFYVFTKKKANLERRYKCLFLLFLIAANIYYVMMGPYGNIYPIFYLLMGVGIKLIDLKKWESK